MLSPQQRAVIVLNELKKLFPGAKTILRFSNNWELLVAVMLSAQTTDKQVNAVTERLFKKYPTLKQYTEADPAVFEADISSVNYFKTKARHVLGSAMLLRYEYGGLLPKMAEELMRFPGVGRKTALVVLGNAYGIVEGIAVDTHVERLSKVFGLSKQKQPEKIEQDLIAVLPKDEWFNFTNRMIDYGRTYCPARCTHQTCPILKKLSRG